MPNTAASCLGSVFPTHLPPVRIGSGSATTKRPAHSTTRERHEDKTKIDVMFMIHFWRGESFRARGTMSRTHHPLIAERQNDKQQAPWWFSLEEIIEKLA